MIYSVWNQGARKYDYYESPEVQKQLHAPVPSHIPAAELGANIDQAAWPLPASAVIVGRGDVAKGRIAVRRGAQALSGIPDRSTVAMFGLGLVAFLLWKTGALE